MATPTISISVSEGNTYLKSLGLSTYLKGFSQLAVSLSINMNGERFRGVSVTVDGKVYNGTSIITQPLENAGSQTVSVTVTYGNEVYGIHNVSASRTITVTNYEAPTIEGPDASWINDNSISYSFRTFAYSVSGKSFSSSAVLKKLGEAEGTKIYTPAYREQVNKTYSSALLSKKEVYELTVTISDGVYTTTKSTVLGGKTLASWNANHDAIGIGCVAPVESKKIKIADDWELLYGGDEISSVLSTNISNTINKSILATIKSQIVDLVYPIGSFFITTDSRSDPGTLFGGSWEQIKGRVLIGVGTCYDTQGNVRSITSGAQYGEWRVALSTANLPAHTHSVRYATSGTEASGYGLTSTAGFQNRVLIDKAGASTGSAGNGNSFPIDQPSYGTYIWHRTA